jgi:hypothetical protein
MKSKNLQTIKVFGLIITGIFISINFVSAQKCDWLEDQPPTDRITRVQTNKFSVIDSYPRRSTGSLKNPAISSASLSTFDVGCSYPFDVNLVKQSQALNPKQTFLRIYTAQEWQGYIEAVAGRQGMGYPFVTSGTETANTKFFPGHFAYKGYTVINSEIGTGNNIALTINAPGKISEGIFYYCIRPSEKDWTDAEQVKIQKSGSTITIIERGYKSNPKNWPAGSVIAQHQLGNGFGDIRNWVYNLSTKCPVDALGKKAYESLSDWFANNYDEDQFGNPITGMTVDGILYDSDFYLFGEGGPNRDADFDNNGGSDKGIDPDGTNFWGIGLDLFYKGVREGIDKRGHTNAVILGGVAETFGLKYNNGTQMEAAWSRQFDEDGALAGAYNHIGFYVSGMKAQTGHGIIGPRITDVQSKEASAIYHGSKIETRNAPVRFSYAMSMMFDGTWFSNQNGFGDAFHYFDEDAVYLSPGENYGKSVLKSNAADIRANNKWLGKAIGPYQRVYDSNTFKVSNNKVVFGNFETQPSGWTTTNCTVSLSTDIKYQGSSSLLITPTTPNANTNIEGATAQSPLVALNLGENTICFSIYSEVPARRIQIRLGALAQSLYITPGWSKHVLCWNQTSAYSSAIKFDVGGELTKVWIDQLYIFAGAADVFRRDFENGIIVANASSSPQTIKLGKSYQRILGNLDAAVNNGQIVNEVTIPAHDGLFLIKPATTSSSKMKESRLLVSPNPFTDQFSLNIPEGASKLNIFDSTGKNVFNQYLAEQRNITVDFSKQHAGIYFIKLTGKKVNYQSKILKK